MRRIWKRELSQRKDVVMTQITGTYRIDLETSAKLKAGYFHDRFVMKEGYDEALKQYLLDNAELVAAISMTIDATSMKMSSEDGEESFRVLEFDENATPGKLVVDWGEPVAFKVVEPVPGSIYFDSEQSELGEWAWKRVEPSA